MDYSEKMRLRRLRRVKDAPEWVWSLGSQWVDAWEPRLGIPEPVHGSEGALVWLPPDGGLDRVVRLRVMPGVLVVEWKGTRFRCGTAAEALTQLCACLSTQRSGDGDPGMQLWKGRDDTIDAARYAILGPLQKITDEVGSATQKAIKDLTRQMDAAAWGSVAHALSTPQTDPEDEGG